MGTYFSIDRKEYDVALLIGDAGQLMEVPLNQLPPDAREGDMLLYENGVLTPAHDVAAERRKQVAETLAALLRRGDDAPGDE